MIWLINTYLKELSCVLITVVDSDATAENAYIETDTEIGREHREA
jgi:hypothetical protein